MQSRICLQSRMQRRASWLLNASIHVPARTNVNAQLISLQQPQKSKQRLATSHAYIYAGFSRTNKAGELRTFPSCREYCTASDSTWPGMCTTTIFVGNGSSSFSARYVSRGGSYDLRICIWKTYVYACTYVCMHVCMHVCMYVCRCTHIHDTLVFTCRHMHLESHQCTYADHACNYTYVPSHLHTYMHTLVQVQCMFRRSVCTVPTTRVVSK
jgi:hypothetical protein